MSWSSSPAKPVMNPSSFKYSLLVKDDHLDRKVVRYDALPKQINGDAFYQYMRYEQDFLDHFNNHGTESRFYGPKFTDYIPFDFDGDGKVQKQLQQAVYDFVQFIYLEYDVPVNSIKVYYSGSKGFHVLIPSKLLRLQPRYSLERYIRVLAESLVKGFAVEPYLDSGLYNTNSLIRLPNSVNYKSGLYKIPIRISELRDFSILQIKQIAKRPRVDDWSIPSTELMPNDDLVELWEETLGANTRLGDRDIKKRLKIGVHNGYRHNAATSLAFAMAWKGFDQERIEQELQSWNYLNTPPLADKSWREGAAARALDKVGDRAPVNEFRLFCQIQRNSPFIYELPDSQLRVFIQLIASTNTRDHEFRKITIPRASLVISYKTLGDRSNTTKDVARETVRKLVEEGFMSKETHPQRTALILTWQGKFRGLLCGVRPIRFI